MKESNVIGSLVPQQELKDTRKSIVITQTDIKTEELVEEIK